MWYRVCIFLLCCGCSVKPLYELKTEAGSETESEAGAVAPFRNNIFVNVVAGKNGQMLRGYLQDLIRDLDISDEHYTLSVTLREVHIPYALADDGNAQRLKINFIADVDLKNFEGESVLSTSVSESTTRNVASSQGDILLSMYDRVNGSVLKGLAFRIVENLRLTLAKKSRQSEVRI